MRQDSLGTSNKKVQNSNARTTTEPSLRDLSDNAGEGGSFGVKQRHHGAEVVGDSKIMLFVLQSANPKHRFSYLSTLRLRRNLPRYLETQTREIINGEQATAKNERSNLSWTDARRNPRTTRRIPRARERRRENNAFLNFNFEISTFTFSHLNCEFHVTQRPGEFKPRTRCSSEGITFLLKMKQAAK